MINIIVAIVVIVCAIVVSHKWYKLANYVQSKIEELEGEDNA